MAKGQKTGGRDFKPGHTTGRPRKPKDLKVASKLTRTEIEAKLVEFMRMSGSELSALLKDTDAPMLDVMIARIIVMAAKNGDQVRLDFLLNRLIGKVQDKVEHSMIKPTVIERLDGGQMVLDPGKGEE